MLKNNTQNRTAAYVKKVLKSGLLLTALFVYLLVPFKQQFLETVHLIDHFSQHEQIIHSHDHLDGEADHHHGYMAFVSNDNKKNSSEHPIPTELVNYQFQIPLPSHNFNISAYIPLVIGKTTQLLFIPILNGPAFDVPHPPP